jgi:hypothetical protein
MSRKDSHASLVFEETETERTQEFVLRWSGDGGRSFRKIVRQQWNFSPPNTIREVEEYQVEITDVTVLELVIAGHQSRSGSRLAQESASVLTSLSTHGRRDACTGTLPRGAHTRSFEHPPEQIKELAPQLLPNRDAEIVTYCTNTH